MRSSRLGEPDNRFEIKTERRPRNKAVSVTLIVLVCLAVFIILAVNFGGVIGAKIVNPIMSVMGVNPAQSSDIFVPTNSKSPDTPVANISHTIPLTLPGFNCFSLSAGSFDTVDACSQTVKKITDIGGAGYIYFYENKFHVLISGYLTKSDTEKVQTKLSAAGIESSVLGLSCPTITVNVESQDAAEFTRNLMIKFESNATELYALGIEHDKGTKTQAEVKTKLLDMAQNFEVKSGEVFPIIGQTEFGVALSEMLHAHLVSLQFAIDCEDSQSLSVALRQAFLALFEAREVFYSEQLTISN